MTTVTDYTIYRINLEDWEAGVWKQITGTEEDVKREMRKIRGFVKKNEHPYAFVYRENRPAQQLIIPVL